MKRETIDEILAKIEEEKEKAHLRAYDIPSTTLLGVTAAYLELLTCRDEVEIFLGSIGNKQVQAKIDTCCFNGPYLQINAAIFHPTIKNYKGII